MAIDIDEPCGVCNETRDMHGDKNHKFSAEGQLIPLETKPKPPVQVAPSTMQSNLILRMVEVLIQKGLLVGDDLTYIFGGVSAPGHTGPDQSTTTTNN